MAPSKLTGTSSKEYVCVDDDVKISGNTLKMAISRGYEHGWSDSEKINFGKFYPLFFSLFGTLLISVLTCEQFVSFFGLSSEIIRYIFITLCVLSLIFGIASLVFSRINKTKSFTDQRESSVNSIVSQVGLNDLSQK